MEEKKYYIGIDPISKGKSHAGICVMKQTDDGMEVVGAISISSKYAWWNKLKYKFYVWYIHFKYYGGNKTWMMETNERLYKNNHYKFPKP